MWAMEHQSDEEARKWSEKLDHPLPGQQQSDELEEDEIDQLKNL